MTELTDSTTSTPLAVTLTLTRLEEMAHFTAYLRMEAADGGAEGFGLNGATMVTRVISRDAWEGLGMPVVLAVTLRAVQA